MTVTGQDAGQDADTTRALDGLADGRSSVRLRAALAAGTAPEPRFVGELVERCAIEPEFFVRETLTWALTRHAVDEVLPALVRELGSERVQARSQTLHTLSKIGDRRAWPAITPALLSDPDDEVARSAWRAAVVLVPEGEEAALAAVLAAQLGRGDRTGDGRGDAGDTRGDEYGDRREAGYGDARGEWYGDAHGEWYGAARGDGRGDAHDGRETQLSLSRALVELGEAGAPALLAATTVPDPRVRAHALATQRLLREPDIGFAFAIEEAKRVVALGGAGQEGP
jgi:hypothetical protein